VKITALDRKLLRDLLQLRGQALAIGMVTGAGVALFVLLLSTFSSLELTKRTYYESARLADVFASLKRAPLSLVSEIARIPGVAEVETRVVVDVTLDVRDAREPVSGRLISVPDVGRPILNVPVLRAGRWLSPDRPDDVLVSANFAAAHRLSLGDRIGAVINGHWQRLRIVGTALSPEYVYSIRPGQLMPDDRLFGVLWMARRPLAAAFQMDGAFNDVSLSLTRAASAPGVRERLDRLLDPYGGLGAVPRAQQISNWYLQSELASLKGVGAVIPLVFLAVAALLLHATLGRIVSLQREQIAALKALGYAHPALGWHYMKWGLVIAGLGAILGVPTGAWLGERMTEFYTEFFHFPVLAYRLPPEIVAIVLLATAAAAVLGAVSNVRRVVRLPPADAMRPEPPAAYHRTVLERAGLRRLLSRPGRIILRNLAQKPLRAALSVMGVACGGALFIVSAFSLDAVDAMTDLEFNVKEHYDATLAFTEPRSWSALSDVRHLPGVMDAEPLNAVAVRLRYGPHARTTSLVGLPAQGRLDRIVDTTTGRPVSLPPEGLLLSEELAHVLQIERGSRVRVEMLQGRRAVREATVVELVPESMGLGAYMELGALDRLANEGRTLSGAFLRVNGSDWDAFFSRVKRIPAVAAVTLKQEARRSLEQTIGESIGITRTVATLFAAIMAFGVVYNSARISYSERAGELATLRVIGFTRAEISYIFLGEQAIITLLALPLGLALGYLLAAGTVSAYQTEVYRLPLVIYARTYALAAVTVLVAAVGSGLVVRRKLDRLDLVGVLKARE
jgi:putative ABC transport system permease protein